MRLGLVGCSQLKLPVPAPAWLLYSASPRFSQTYQVARAECDEVRILSAYYGVVHPTQILAPYNLVLSDLSGPRRVAWGQGVRKVLQELGADLRVYCSAQYCALLAPLTYTRPYRGDLFTVAQSMGHHGSLRQIDWPMYWLLTYIQERNGIAMAQILREIVRRGYVSATVSGQRSRITRCPLYHCAQGKVWLRYVLTGAQVPVLGRGGSTER